MRVTSESSLGVDYGTDCFIPGHCLLAVLSQSPLLQLLFMKIEKIAEYVSKMMHCKIFLYKINKKKNGDKPVKAAAYANICSIDFQETRVKNYP